MQTSNELTLDRSEFDSEIASIIDSPKRAIKMIGHDYQDYEDDLRREGVPFLSRMSGYTTIIETHEFKWIFNDDIAESDFKFVDVAEKIKEDVNRPDCPVIDEVKEFDLIYFDCHNNLPDELKLRTAHNVDITNCYLTTSLNFGIIRKETFDYANTLKEKLDKHKAFGMLATNYTCFYFNSGELKKVFPLVNEFERKYFFAVVSEISGVMKSILSELYEDFIFYWVDGIYFKSKRAAMRAQEILKNNQFKSSYDLLPNFELTRDDFRYIIKFGPKGDQKAFTVPKLDRDNKLKSNIVRLRKTM
jgi:hypothetical protein